MSKQRKGQQGSAEAGSAALSFPPIRGKPSKTRLSEREWQAVAYRALGYKRAQIAEYMGIGVNTVKEYLDRAYEAEGTNDAEAIFHRYADPETLQYAAVNSLRRLASAARKAGVEIFDEPGLEARPSWHTRPFGELLSSLDSPPRLPREIASVDVTKVTEHSWEVEPGTLFVARKGARHDGEKFAAGAARSGAVAILAKTGTALPKALGSVPVIEVPDLPRATARLSAALWNYPSRRVRVIGVVGTWLAPVVALLTSKILHRGDAPVGVIGTDGVFVGGQFLGTVSHVTTPTSSQLHGGLRILEEKRLTTVLLELTPQALIQGRVAECEFRQLIYTSLGPIQHGDAPPWYDPAVSSIRRLFAESTLDRRVIDVDDELGSQLAQASKATTFSTGHHGATVYLRDRQGAHWKIVVNGEEQRFAVNAALQEHPSEVLAAVAVAADFEINPETVSDVLQISIRAHPPCEVILSSQGGTVVYLGAESPRMLSFGLAAAMQMGQEVSLVLTIPDNPDVNRVIKMARIAAIACRNLVLTTSVDTEVTADLKEALDLVQDHTASAAAFGGCRIVAEPRRSKALELGVSSLKEALRKKRKGVLAITRPSEVETENQDRVVTARLLE